MNRSGASARALAHYHRIPDHSLLVVHDELDLEAGVVRLKRSGGHGGHNGLRDLHAQLGSDQYRRLRLGIGHPGVSSEVMNYVLSKPSSDDRVHIEAAIEVAVETLPKIVRGELEQSMNVLHAR
jgi:PTH1 family peptidyl-tRNA hydrolase